jgi:hypothetical protein
MKKLAALALGALFALGSVATTADAQAYYGTTETAHGYLNVANITAATVVKASPGVVATVCVVVAGTAGNDQINDTTTTGGAAASNLVWSAAYTVATLGSCVNLEMPMNSGIVVTPATGATLAVFYR